MVIAGDLEILAAMSLSEDIAQITRIMRDWAGAVRLLPPALLETDARNL